MTKERKTAGFISLLAAAGNLGAVAIIISAANFTEFISILPASPKILFLLLSGVISLIIGVMILAPLETGKGAKLTALVISIAVFAIAAVQMSITLVFVLLWPWSLYKLYRSDNA